MSAWFTGPSVAMLSLRTKILAAAALLVLLTQVGTVSSVLFTAHRSVAERASRTLEEGIGVLEGTVRGRGTQLGNTVAALAADFAFKRAVATGDTATVQSALANHAQRAGASVAALLREDGSVIAGTTGFTATPEQNRKLVRMASNGGAGHGAVVWEDRAYELIVVPVRAPLPIAWAVMGFAVSDAYAESLARLTGLEVSFVAHADGDSRLLATSVDGADRRDLELGPDFLLASEPVPAQFAGAERLAIARPYIAGDASPGTASLMVLMTLSIDDAMAPYRLLRTAAVVLGALPLIVALVGAFLFSRALTQPVQKLVRAVRRMQAGDYSQPVEIPSGDELGEFATAFNLMQTEIARREAEIVHQARHDALTELPNRSALLDRLQEEIAHAASEEQSLALVAIHLNGLGEIGPTFGHDLADEYVCEAARQLKAACGEEYPLARLDGDAFILVLPRHDARAAEMLGEGILRRLSAGIELAGMNVTVRPNLGIAVFPEHGTTQDQLLLRATIAQSESQAGRRAVSHYLDGAEQRRLRRMTILADLRPAIRHEQLQLYYQPKVSPGDGIVRSAEALVRWEHPSLGPISPSEFIPIAEQSGNIGLLTRWALTAAICECRFWQEQGLDLGVSVNVSANDLLDDGLISFITDELRDHDLATRKLTLEITEEAVVQNFEQTTAVLRRLRELGIRIAIDDFGTGYSSLSQLKNLPVDELKIDRSFVTNLPFNESDVAIVKAAMQLARDLRMSFVAEGVETRDAVDWFGQQGAEFAQGYYYSRPQPGPDFVEWVRRRLGGETRRMPHLGHLIPLVSDN